MLDSDSKRETRETDPAVLAQLLEIELMQKRAMWQRAAAGRRNLRALSFLFLFAIIIAALVGFFFFLSPDRVSEMRATRASSTPSPAPTAK